MIPEEDEPGEQEGEANDAYDDGYEDQEDAYQEENY